jgi:hypothetical protein
MAYQNADGTLTGTNAANPQFGVYKGAISAGQNSSVDGTVFDFKAVVTDPDLPLVVSGLNNEAAGAGTYNKEIGGSVANLGDNDSVFDAVSPGADSSNDDVSEIKAISVRNYKTLVRAGTLNSYSAAPTASFAGLDSGIYDQNVAGDVSTDITAIDSATLNNVFYDVTYVYGGITTQFVAQELQVGGMSPGQNDRCTCTTAPLYADAVNPFSSCGSGLKTRTFAWQNCNDKAWVDGKFYFACVEKIAWCARGNPSDPASSGYVVISAVDNHSTKAGFRSSGPNSGQLLCGWTYNIVPINPTGDCEDGVGGVIIPTLCSDAPMSMSRAYEDQLENVSSFGPEGPAMCNQSPPWIGKDSLCQYDPRTNGTTCSWAWQS